MEMVVQRKILLIGIFPESQRVRWMSAPYVLKAYFKKNSSKASQVCIDILDASNADPVEEILQSIIAYQPEVIGISCYTWNVTIVRTIVAKIKALLPMSIIILGGPEISLHNAEAYTQDPCFDADYCIIGEGEVAFVELIEEILESKDKNEKKRISGRVDLTKSPSIYLTETVPEERYDGQLVFMETQRGCKYRCAYCVYHKNLTDLTFMPLEQMKEEISFLLTRKNITSVRIIDANFSANISHAKSIMNHFLKLACDGFFLDKLMIEFDYKDTDEEFISVISRMKKRKSINNYEEKNLPVDKPVGDSFIITSDYTVFIGVGIQSFNNASLRAVNRAPVIKEKFEHFLGLVHEYNIILKLDIILGLPYETVETYIDGLSRLLYYIEKTDHYLQFSFLQVLPGAPIEEMVEDLGLYYDFETKFVYKTNAMSENELIYCAKVTILVNRIINSPLRTLLFKIADNEKDNYSIIELITDIFQSVSENFQEFIELSTIEAANKYNESVFSNIPQSFLEKRLFSFGQGRKRN